MHSRVECVECGWTEWVRVEGCVGKDELQVYGEVSPQHRVLQRLKLQRLVRRLKMCTASVIEKQEVRQLTCINNKKMNVQHDHCKEHLLVKNIVE